MNSSDSEGPVGPGSEDEPDARFHVPVLLEPVLEYWITEPQGRYVDATAGDAGHSLGALRRLGAGARILALDRDPGSLERASKRLKDEPRVLLRHARYDQLGDLLAELGWDAVDGLLADLGVSSLQLDTPERGFSFRFDAPLDMRMDPGEGESAARWLAAATEEEIADVFFYYGEIHRSRSAARCVIRARERGPIQTTGQLAHALGPVTGGRNPRAELARYFQALRIQVNGELDSLDRFLEGAPRWVRPGGRFVVMAYHSLEDRKVKQSLKSEHWEALTRRAVQGRTDPNPRARSVRLRAAVRT